jgi:hypothetical protein
MTEQQAGTRRRGRPPRSLAAKTPIAEEAAIQAGEIPSERPPMRPPMREEDPRAAAARRAAEIRGHLGNLDEGVDKFALPPAPDGWTYEWKRRAVFGKEDHSHMLALKRMGWEEVPAARYPDMMPDQGNYGTIERDGMVMMMRPAVITEELRQIELQKARDQVRYKQEQLAGTPEGGLGHRDHAQVKPKINKSYEAIPVPKD